VQVEDSGVGVAPVLAPREAIQDDPQPPAIRARVENAPRGCQAGRGFEASCSEAPGSQVQTQVSEVVVDIVAPPAAGGLGQQADDVPLAAQLVAESTRVGEEERYPDQGPHVQGDPEPDGGVPPPYPGQRGAADARALRQGELGGLRGQWAKSGA
jgi:hypothetical protein